MLNGHRRADPASRCKVRDNLHRSWSGHSHEIVKYRVRYMLVERTVITVLLQIDFQRLQLEAELVGNVANIDRAKIGLSGNRANRSELGTHGVDHIVAIRKRILESFESIAEVIAHC